jgi:hypothetical protein
MHQKLPANNHLSRPPAITCHGEDGRRCSRTAGQKVQAVHEGGGGRAREEAVGEAVAGAGRVLEKVAGRAAATRMICVHDMVRWRAMQSRAARAPGSLCVLLALVHTLCGARAHSVWYLYTQSCLVTSCTPCYVQCTAAQLHSCLATSGRVTVRDVVLWCVMVCDMYMAVCASDDVVCRLCLRCAVRLHDTSVWRVEDMEVYIGEVC